MAHSHKADGPFFGRLGWLLHRMVASYWSLPLLGVLAAIPAAIAMLAIDREGLGALMLDNDLDPVATADTAKDLLAVAVGINAAFITLYFSLTLLVLTVASSNLGVRLVDRWLDKRLVRVSLAGLSFTLIYSLAAMAAVDAEATKADTPVALVASVIFLQGVNVAMLTVALHDLGRTIFVDRSIANLADDSSDGPVSVQESERLETDWAVMVTAPREGYIEGNDLSRLLEKVGDGAGRIRVCAAPGQHVLEGEALLLIENALPEGLSPDDLRSTMPVGAFRSDSQGAVFRIRLLVEIAARALSPAVNDFYTALTAGDRLTAVMLGQRGNWVDGSKMPVYADDARIELPGQDFRGLFDDPLSAFRQAACQYPSVSIRMIDNYARVRQIAADGGQSAEFGDFIAQCARELRDHAASVATYDGDRNDIMTAYKRGFDGNDG